MDKIIRTIKRIIYNSGFDISRIKNLATLQQPKYIAEITFWRYILKDYILWYNGNIEKLYEEPTPINNLKVKSYNESASAILTWFNIHQKTKYKEDLKLDVNCFKGEKLLDIGSGPIPSALIFNDCAVYSLDPLHPLYLEAGFPIHIYENRAKFVYGFSENMPFENDYFDAIISVNALDHVDNFEATAKEIQRVLKPNGKLRFHLHYHLATPTEPLELNDFIVSKGFDWCSGFRKISVSKEKRGTIITDPNESYTLWSNF